MPVPPRWRGLKRALLIAGVALLALVCLRLAWGWEAKRRLTAKIAEYQAQGEPILPEDFDLPPIPDDQNAAVLYDQAAAALVCSVMPAQYADGSTVSVTAEQLVTHPELIASDPVACGRLLDGCDKSLSLLRAAQALPSCQRYRPLPQPLYAGRTGIRDRSLVKLLCGAAEYEFQMLRDENAINYLSDAVALTDREHMLRAGTIATLIASSCDELIADVIEHAAGDLVVGTLAEAPADIAQPATRRDMECLISDLLDESARQARWREECRWDRLYATAWVEAMCAGQLSTRLGPGWTTVPPAAWETPVRWLLAPLWRLDLVRLLEHTTEMSAAGQSANWPAAVAAAPPDWPTKSALGRHVHYPDLYWGHGHDPVVRFRMFFGAWARRQMAATALAVRLYRLDYEHRPATLDELVPDYLPRVPSDPFTADDSPLRYAPDADPPVLYSVGPNGRDDGGWFVCRPELWTTEARESRVWTGPPWFAADWDHTDIPFALDGGMCPLREFGEADPHESRDEAEHESQVKRAEHDAGDDERGRDDAQDRNADGD